MSTILDVCNVTYKKLNRIIVDNVSFNVLENELFVILGEHNSGKTNLVKMLCNINTPKNGNIYINGSSYDENKNMISYIPQKMALSGHLTVYENMELIVRINGCSILDAKAKIDELLKEYNLFDRADDKASTLSFLLKKKLSILMGLISNPQILILDNPWENLNEKSKKDIEDMISNLKNKITIIISTNSIELTNDLADRLCIFSGGKILDIGTIKELKEKYNKSTLREVFLNLAKEE